MSLVVLEGVSLGFGKKQLVENLDLRVGRTDRVGLVGPNGSGKSSLLKMIAGEASPDSGSIRYQRQLRIGYLPQELPIEGGRSLLDSVLASVPGREQLEVERTRWEQELADAQARGEDDAMMEAATALSDVHEHLTNFELHHSPHEALRILSGLGFRESDHGRDLKEFSGGWRMRAMLAGLLFQRPDLLLLDEPTNHLDLPSVAWFSSFLRGYAHGFVLICHDREFLNEQIDRVVSLEAEGVRQFRGDWEHYVKQRAEEEIVLENQARNQAREREKAEQFINRFRAQANKAKAVQSRIKQLEKLDDVQTFVRRKVMRFQFPPCARTGNEVLRIEGLRKVYGSHVVLDGVDLRVARGEKIGIIGVNGAGKTTLLRTIAGEIRHDAGSVTVGHNVKLGYYAQHHADALDLNHTIVEEVAARDRSANETSVRTLLGSFLFSDDDVEKPIRVLSGGERARVALANLLAAPGNLILMDEPTNHLDLESSESLAESLATFDGTLVFVSHNRAFVRRLATKIWNVEGGKVDIYPGTLDEYLERHGGLAAPRVNSAAGTGDVPRGPDARPARSAQPASQPATAQPAGSKDDRKMRKREEAERRAARNRLEGPLKKKIAQLEADIELLERAQRQRNLELANEAVYADERRRRVLLDEYQRDSEALVDLTEAWESATAELERMNQP